MGCTSAASKNVVRVIDLIRGTRAALSVSESTAHKSQRQRHSDTTRARLKPELRACLRVYVLTQSLHGWHSWLCARSHARLSATV